MKKVSDLQTFKKERAPEALSKNLEIVD